MFRPDCGPVFRGRRPCHEDASQHVGGRQWLCERTVYNFASGQLFSSRHGVAQHCVGGFFWIKESFFYLCELCPPGQMGPWFVLSRVQHSAECTVGTPGFCSPVSASYSSPHSLPWHRKQNWWPHPAPTTNPSQDKPHVTQLQASSFSAQRPHQGHRLASSSNAGGSAAASGSMFMSMLMFLLPVHMLLTLCREMLLLPPEVPQQ
jgi:hypothetical protein